jgi:NitT/TauT family transport system ATP-binding protein
LPIPQPLISAERLSATYLGAVQALVDVNLEILQGQFVSVVGPSGCGKSTLLRLVAGLLEPSSGQIMVDGQPPQTARRGGTPMSFVFQDATLLPWRTVTDNVHLPLELGGVYRQPSATAAATVLGLVGLTDFSHRFPAQLSGGMKMRAALARALVTHPKLILLDEPFGALDDITRQTLNEELLTLWRDSGWTALFVTHNISEAVFLSQRVLVMSPRPGRIVADIQIPFGARTTGLRATPEFARLTGEVGDQLRRAHQ